MSTQESHKSNDIVHQMETWFAKAPELPKNAKDTLVNIMPWIALVFGVLGVLGAVSAFGLLSVASPLALFGGVEGVSSYGTGIIAAIIWLGSAALMLAAFPGLKARTHQGWKLLFWSEVVSLIGSIVSISSLVSGIIGALIGFYILFQIKSHYK